MKLLTIPDACEILRISRSKLYAHWADGNGPKSLWIGNQRRIRQTDLEDWINSQAA